MDKPLPNVHPLAPILNNYRDMLAREWPIAWKHVYREANRAVDWITNHASTLSLGLTRLDSPPLVVLTISYNDVKGVAPPRFVYCSPRSSINEMASY